MSVAGKLYNFLGMTPRPGFPAKLPEWLVGICYFSMSLFFLLLFRMKIRGYCHVPKNSACVFIGNHGSHYDIFMLHVAIHRSDPRPVVPLVWYRLLEFAVVGSILQHLQAIPVDNEPSGTPSRAKSLRSMIRHLRDGRHILLLPEGHRSDELDKFHPGAALISIKTGAPLVPISLRGVQPLYKNVGDFPRLWGRVEMVFHPPLYPVDLEGSTDEEKTIRLMAKARAAVASALDYPVGAD